MGDGHAGGTSSPQARKSGQGAAGREVRRRSRCPTDQRAASGEATFWMVDQAVLSLAKERRLDPLPDFIVGRRPMARATRATWLSACLPLQEIPGGGDAGLDEMGRGDQRIRAQNFTPVPIYLPSGEGPADGVEIKIKLPDTLRCSSCAQSGERSRPLGFATGADPPGAGRAQPRFTAFVQPGDTFDAGLIAQCRRRTEDGGGARHSREDGGNAAPNDPRTFAWDSGNRRVDGLQTARRPSRPIQ